MTVARSSVNSLIDSRDDARTSGPIDHRRRWNANRTRFARLRVSSFQSRLFTRRYAEAIVRARLLKRASRRVLSRVRRAFELHREN